MTSPRMTSIAILALSSLLPLQSYAAVTFSRDKLKGSTRVPESFVVTPHFGVQIDGTPVEGVESVQGLLELLYAEYEEGGENESTRIAMIIHDSTDVKGIAALESIWAGTVTGRTDRKSISVVYYNDAGNELDRVVFTGVRVVEWKHHDAQGLDAPTADKASGQGTEKFVLTFDRYEVK